MFRLTYNPEELRIGPRGRTLRLTQPDPEWLVRDAEHDRIVRQMRSESRANSVPGGLVSRVRLAFNRS